MKRAVKLMRDGRVDGRQGKSRRALARRIATDLFTNGLGQFADRLVLELPGKVDGGGWNFTSAIDRIERALKGQRL